jgi:hypothetical protein
MTTSDGSRRGRLAREDRPPDLGGPAPRGIPRYIGPLNQHPAMWELLYEYDCAVRGWSGIPPYHRAA